MKRTTNWLVLLIILGGLFGLPGTSALAQSVPDVPEVVLIQADGAITPPMAEYIDRGLKEAALSGAELVILQLNTPGGEVDVMNRIVQSIRQSPVPVVVYVAPRGAMAASAGTVITLAGHAAAMAPETAIGAASPVGSQGEDIGTTMETKVKEILKATVRSLAENRSPEAVALAEDTIEHARAVSASEALKAGLVDYLAPDVPALLQQLDGKTLTTATGKVTLHTTGAPLREIQPTFIEQLLQMLTNPNLVFLLLSIGAQAILIELSNPGSWVPGFIGVVCMALAVYGLGVLPVNWFGLLFILMAFVLFFLEVKTPVHGAMAAAGIGSFMVGALVLFNSPGVPSFQRVSVPLVAGTAIITGILVVLVIGFALRALKTPVKMGEAELIGKTGRVQETLHPHGLVQVGGEQWSAEPENEAEIIAAGERITVVRVEGNHLIVKRG